LRIADLGFGFFLFNPQSAIRNPFLTFPPVSSTFQAMGDPFQEILQNVIPLQPTEGRSKVMPLGQAVRMLVEPGMALHLGIACIPPTAVIYELVRQFRGRDPRFTLFSLGLTTVYSLLVHAGLLRKIITTFLGDSYPSPAPNPVFQRALREKTVEIQHWSLLSMVQRLKAGALGVGSLPTRSILGSSMEKDNRDDFAAVEDPFREGEKLGLVRSINADLSFYHALAADPQGNALFVPPYAENLYGAMGSKRGAIVTAEKIVSTDFLRANAGYVRLPGYRVLAVCEVPRGGHPSGVSTHGITGVEGYAVDNPFVFTLRQACRKKETLDAWMEEWVFSCPDHAAYMKKLGPERVRNLMIKARPDAWKSDTESIRPKLDIDEPTNAMERMVIAAAREVISRVKRNQYRTLLAGIGASNLAAWMGTYLLRQEGYEVDVMAEIGFFGYLPRPADPFIFNLSNVPTCKMLTDVSEILGILMGGENQRCMGALSAAQVDRWGNLNSTLIPPDILITGSGGANDVASGASEVLVTVPHSPSRFVPEVSYITAPGQRVRTVVTTLGMFEKVDGEREFALTGVMEDGHSSAEETVRSIREQCKWDLKIASRIKTLELPTAEELALLRLFDPHKVFLTENT
jgi:acyl CoA:acetate/3-ketoacid CoA transferase alpha subunit/acyl CoA:acetate/3-ketoacid CoA transferase beta subunit